MKDILTLVARTALLWGIALGVFRLMGKRTLGKMGPFDFAVAIMIGESVAIGMSTHEPLVHAVAATIMLGLLQWLLTWLNLRFRWLEKLTQGKATVVITNGKIDEKALKNERFSKPDLFMELRQNKIYKLSDVKKARLEPTGKLSVEPASQSSSQSQGSSSTGSQKGGGKATSGN